MKKEVFGYVLGGLMFVLLIPTLMWLASGMPCWCVVPVWRWLVVLVLAVLGLSLSVWSIVYMRRKGDGNPMDAFGHEVAPRTKHLMTDGPYRLSRNPMLTGSLWGLSPLCFFKSLAKRSASVGISVRSMRIIARGRGGFGRFL